jgi:tetratricopeptide (TPR) repeat protein
MKSSQKILLSVALALASSALAGTPRSVAPFRPTDPDFVVAELPDGASRARDAFARQQELARTDPQFALSLATGLVAQARALGLPQLYGRAESVLSPWISRGPVGGSLLALQADILQQRHEFSAAVALLDRAIAEEPRLAQAHSMRANVRIVTGDFEAARPDCAWLLGSGAQWVGSVCMAQVLGSTGQLRRARLLLERLMAADAEAQSAEVLAWTLSVRADLSARDGDLPEAESFLTRAVALTPAADYTRLALADVLMAQGHPAQALGTLQAARPSVGVLLRRALVEAHDPAGSAAATRNSLSALQERLAVSAQRGERTHLREEARLALELAAERNGERTEQLRSAVALARDNFAIQRETEDVRLLARAAVSARDSAALAFLEEWLHRLHYQDVVVDRLLHAGAAS